MIKTTKQDLKELFFNLDIKKGEHVMIHTSLFSLGLIENGISGFFDVLFKLIGPEGTLIVPTFTYSFRRNEVFDIANSPSAKNIGVFSEYIRNHPSSIRSSDPLFSMSSIGALSRDLMQRDNHKCFGEGSIYNKLFDKNIHFVAIGITYSTGLAGFMNLEKLANVPYREDATFYGKSIAKDGNYFDDKAVHFALKQDDFNNFYTDREPMGLILEKKKISNSIKYGYGKHMSLYGLDWRDEVLSKLLKEPFFMFKKEFINER